jgi:uncharacterized protein YdeI (YjbR/CyaY-like superfamily)
MTLLARPRHPMPDFVREALAERGLGGAYAARPPYQRNDYIGWIAGAKQEATRRRRLDQMLAELAAGDRYMKMPWRPGRRRGDGAGPPAARAGGHG